MHHLASCRMSVLVALPQFGKLLAWADLPSYVILSFSLPDGELLKTGTGFIDLLSACARGTRHLLPGHSCERELVLDLMKSKPFHVLCDLKGSGGTKWMAENQETGWTSTEGTWSRLDWTWAGSLADASCPRDQTLPLFKLQIPCRSRSCSSCCSLLYLQEPA